MSAGAKVGGSWTEPDCVGLRAILYHVLFRAGRTFEEFVAESKSHGWPSFRDEEVVWDNVRCLKDGECVSVDGTHLGHNLPDRSGNRYCINLVSVAGEPERKD